MYTWHILFRQAAKGRLLAVASLWLVTAFVSGESLPAESVSSGTLTWREHFWQPGLTISAGERLSEEWMSDVRQIELALQSAEEDATYWMGLERLLQYWEQVSDLRLARSYYVELLLAWGGARQLGLFASLPEQAFTEKLRRVLLLDLAGVDRARVLFVLAQVKRRGPEPLEQTAARVEPLLLEAMDLAGDTPLLADIVWEIAQLNDALGRIFFHGNEGVERSQHMTRAAAFYERFMELTTVADDRFAEAERALAHLRLEEIVGRAEFRYLPLNEVRLSIWVRNIDVLTVTVSNASGETLLSKQEDVLLSPAAVHDWISIPVSLGDNLPIGMYAITLSAGTAEATIDLYISSLEVFYFEATSGGPLVWVVDLNTGSAVEGAHVVFYDVAEQELLNGVTDVRGLVQTSAQLNWSWHYFTVRSGHEKLKIERDADRMGVMPVDSEGVLTALGKRNEPMSVLPVTLAINPGQTLQWLSYGRGVPPSGREALDVRTPCGRILAAKTVGSTGNLFIHEVDLPDDLVKPGPVWVKCADDHWQFLVHLQVPVDLPLKIAVAGHALQPGYAVFHAQDDLRLELERVDPGFLIPDLLRLRITVLGNKAQRTTEEAITEPLPAPVDQIVLFGGTSDAGIVLSGESLPLVAGLQSFRIDISDLHSGELIGQTQFGLSAYWGTAEIELSQQILTTSGGLGVTLHLEDWSAGNWDSHRRAQLVVVRESWESQFVHRRRGTLITEEAYLALPERSLLGAARTDFVLRQEGTVTEEVYREDLFLREARIERQFDFDKPGRYRVELQGERLQVNGQSAEFYVLPDNLDLRLFRSEQARLIAEQDDRQWRFLLVSNRSPGTALLLAEWADGTLTKERIPMATTAIGGIREIAPGKRLRSVTLLWAADQRSETLAVQLPVRRLTSRELTNGNRFGLRPGDILNWDLPDYASIEGVDGWITLLLKASHGEFLRSYWYRILAGSMTAQGQIPGRISDRLPFFFPLPDAVMQDRGTADSALVDWLEFKRFMLGLFGESLGSIDVPVGLQVSLSADFSAGMIETVLPDSLGTFELIALLPDNGQLELFFGLLSTEQPVQLSIEVPVFLKVGDSTEVRLAWHNRTDADIQLPIEMMLSPHWKLETPHPLPTILSLAAGEQQMMRFGVQAELAGEAEVQVRAESTGVFVKQSKHISVLGDLPAKGIAGHRLSGQHPDAEFSRAGTHSDAEALFVTDSMGMFFAAVWEQWRGAGKPFPVWTALLDWMATEMKLYHGFTVGLEQRLATRERITKELGARQFTNGAWAILEQLPPDIWFTSVCVAMLESFAVNGDSAAPLRQLLADARAFLRTIMSDSSRPRAERITALAALSRRAPADPPRRPTRLQARAFLDFFVMRNELSLVELAQLLHTANAFGFVQEVAVLSEQISQMIPQSLGFYEAAVVYAAIADTPLPLYQRHNILDKAIKALGRVGNSPSFRDMAAMAFIFEAYLRAGGVSHVPDWNLTLDGLELRNLVADAAGIAVMTLERKSSDFSSVLWPEARSFPDANLFVGIIYGHNAPQPESGDIDVAARFTHVMQESLLFGVNRERRKPFAGQIIRPFTDRLEVEWQWELKRPFSYLSFSQQIPAGFSLAMDYQLFRLTGDASDRIAIPLYELSPENTLSATFTRVAVDLPPGHYLFRYYLTAQHAGRFQWFAPVWQNLMDGEVFSYDAGEFDSLIVAP